MQLASWITTEEMSVIFQWGVVIGASLIAAALDVRTGRIPNSLTVPLFALGLIWSTWTGGLSGLATSAGVCILLGLPYVLMFLFAHGGAGDAKLMGAIGTWLGLTQAIIVLLCVASAGIVLSIIKATTKKQLKTVLASVFVSVYNFILSLIIFKKMRPKINLTEDNQSEELDVPYGIAIFAGVCVGAGIVGLWGDKWLW